MKETCKNMPWSCDTFGVAADKTQNGAVLMGKNSDRPVFDCQPLVHHKRRSYPEGEMLRLAYVEIPQAEEAYATVGSAPYWCWGYEEGINEYGVAIGNEAIYTKDAAQKIQRAKEGEEFERGLLGMELLRLGLERAKTAREALKVMTLLIEVYGQWGSAVPTKGDAAGSYNNAFMIADAKEFWVLNTAGREWIAKRYEKGYEAISNEASIRTDWDLISDGLIDEAIRQGWWQEERRDEFDFALAYTDFQVPLQVSHIRAQRNRQLLRKAAGEGGSVDVAYAKRMLRDHYEDTFLEGPYFNAALPDFLSICMHSSPAGFTWGNTASSAIFLLPDDGEHLPMFWWTPVTPCTGAYIPVFAHAGGLPEMMSAAGTAGRKMVAPPDAQEDQSREGSYWWIFRDLLDAAKGDEYGSRFAERQPLVRERFDLLERRWMQEAAGIERQAVELMKKGEKDQAAQLLADFTADCARQAADEAGALIRLFSK